MILAIDPGPVESAWVIYDGEKVHSAGKERNEQVLETLKNFSAQLPVACEMIASYGMAVGAEVFETCVWIGRFIQASLNPVQRVTRIKVKTHLCHSAKAKDANVRQALIDRLGPQGTKKAPGPTYGISGDMWAALAVAVYAYDELAKMGEKL